MTLSWQAMWSKWLCTFPASGTCDSFLKIRISFLLYIFTMAFATDVIVERKMQHSVDVSEIRSPSKDGVLADPAQDAFASPLICPKFGESM